MDGWIDRYNRLIVVYIGMYIRGDSKIRTHLSTRDDLARLHVKPLQVIYRTRQRVGPLVVLLVPDHLALGFVEALA